MAVFIEVKIDDALRKDVDAVKKLEEVCPVDIFGSADGTLVIHEQNLDECTLCELCLSVGKPGQVQVLKLYEDGKPLQRSA